MNELKYRKFHNRPWWRAIDRSGCTIGVIVRAGAGTRQPKFFPDGQLRDNLGVRFEVGSLVAAKRIVSDAYRDHAEKANE